MTQLTIEIEDNKALKLIKDLEALKLIRVLKGNIKDDTSLKGTPVRAKRKLSERLAGSLTAAQAKALDNELKKIRGEWERSI